MSRGTQPRAALALAALLCAGMLSACTGKHLPAGASHVSAHKRVGAGSALTAPTALAFARAVNLTQADLPGFSIATRHSHPTASGAEAERQLSRCSGEQHSGVSPLARAGSRSFTLGPDRFDLSVSSEVGVARSAALAEAELSAIHSARARRCFGRYIQTLFGSRQLNGATLKRVSIQSGNPPAPGASGSFGWRVTATFSVRQLEIPFYLDLLGFRYGAARVTLVSSGALRPFPAPLQQHLFRLLLLRAQAHGL